jgi:hypothetical protein
MPGVFLSGGAGECGSYLFFFVLPGGNSPARRANLARGPNTRVRFPIRLLPGHPVGGRPSEVRTRASTLGQFGREQARFSGGRERVFVIISVASETCGARYESRWWPLSRVDGISSTGRPQVDYDNDVSRQDRGRSAARFSNRGQSASANRHAIEGHVSTLSRRRRHNRQVGCNRERCSTGFAGHLSRTHDRSCRPRAARRIASADCVSGNRENRKPICVRLHK